jgi:exosortase E/protease (VPEID-CTERM system)
MSQATLAGLDLDEMPHAPGRTALSGWRALTLALLLPAEILLLTYRFDASWFVRQPGAWAWLLGSSSMLLKVVLAAAAGTLLLGGARLWRDVQRITREAPPGLPWWSYLAAHLTALVAFAALTAGLFEGGLFAAAPGLWTSAWVLLWLTTLGLWLAVLAPPPVWPRLARAAAVPLLGGCAVSLGVCGFLAAAHYFWHPLALSTFFLVDGLLSLAGFEVVSDPGRLQIGTPSFVVAVAPQCSGYEGVGLILVFLTAYVALFRRHLRFPHVLVLFPAGVVLIWLANAVRIALLLAIGSAGAREVAEGGFHSHAGWLAFNALALGFVGLTTQMRLFQSQDAPAPARRALDPTVAYLAPWLTILAVSLVLAAFTAGFDWFYPARVLAAAAVLWRCRKAYGRWDGSCSWVAVALGAAVFVVWLLLAPRDLLAGGGPPRQWAEAGALWAAPWLAFRIVGSVLTVPLAEEIAFRGYLTRRLVRHDFEQLPLGRMTLTSLVVSSVLFGLLHGRCWPAGVVAGLLFALALRQRGRLADAVAAHLTANALLCGYVLCTGNWSLWN